MQKTTSIRLWAGAALLVLTAATAIAQEAERFTNEKIWYSRTFPQQYVWGIRSMADGLHYTRLERGDNGSEIVQYAYKTGERVATLLTSEQAFEDASIGIDDYTFSADESKLLLMINQTPIYRHSFTADYYIWNREGEGSIIPLSDEALGQQRLATFSPSGDQVAFVRDNNVFITNGHSETQVTTDGEFNKVINGATDWVYEEEFGEDNGLFWSPDGQRLAYYRFDESNVREFSMPVYGELYPDPYTFKYPKAGEENSVVSIHVYDLASGQNRTVDTPQMEYIPRIQWTHEPTTLAVAMMNRHQNDLRLLLADCTAKSMRIPTSEGYAEQCDTYIDVTDNLTFLSDGARFVLTSERDGYNHLYLCDFEGGATALTTGEWDVIEVAGYDAKAGEVYFTGSMRGATQKHLAKVNLKGQMTLLDERPGTHSAEFSRTFAYRIHTHQDANTPPTYSLVNRKGKEIRVLEDNAELREVLATYNVSPKEFFRFTNRAGVELNGWMIKPADFDPSRAYPVYVNIYGGPGSNMVEDRWGGANYYWHQLLAQEGYIVACVDPRGTQFRGREFEHSTYKELGKLETEDFIDFGRWLGEQSYVDAERIGIQGWSYGGFETLLCMTKGADVFSAGISVAPVTNWRYYDTIYTERFMQTPAENPSGYDDNSPVFFADLLEGDLLLIHGSGDDNVHFQNSMEMVNALVAAGKDFDFFAYPNRNHGIYGGNTRLHLFDMMLDFVKENL